MTHQLRQQHSRHEHHDHEHEHEHAHSRLGRWAHAVSELLGGHSHDTADQVDSALEADARGRRALWLSLAGLGLTAALQAVAFAATDSVALLGDALHNVADALTAVPILIAFALARRSPTDSHTYGFGRAEDLAGLFVVAMIALSSLLAGYEAVSRLLDPQPVTRLWALATAGVVGFLGNELVARYRITVGRQIGSAALVADGLHARTDGFTSLAVVFGAAGVAVGWTWADPVIGLLITLAIVGVLRSAVRQVGDRLMDAVDPSLVARARDAILTVDGVVAIDSLRMRWVGHGLHAESSLVVPHDLSLAEGHEIAHHAEAHLRTDLPHVREVTIHVSPTVEPA